MPDNLPHVPPVSPSPATPVPNPPPHRQALPQWNPIDPRPFRRRERLFRTVGLVLATPFVGYYVWVRFSTQQVGWSDFVWLVLSLGAFMLLVVPPLVIAGCFEDKAASADLLNAFWATVASNRKFVLLLRSFKSKLVSETRRWVQPVEREVEHPRFGFTGRKYTDYVTVRQTSDDVRQFLTAAGVGIHVVVIDGQALTLSAGPLTILSSEGDWWPIFAELLRQVQLVVVVPEGSDSLGQEIRAVVETALHKAVFLMPPSEADGPAERAKWNMPDWMLPRDATAGTFLTGLTRREGWNAMRDKLPLPLPEYTEEGAILSFPATDTVPITLPYTHRAFATLLATHASDGAPLANAVAALNAAGLLGTALEELERRRTRLSRWF